MKVYYIGILKKNPEDSSTSIELCSSKDLSQFGFFERSSVSQFMTFFSDTVASRTGPGVRQSIEEGENYVGHVYTRTENITGVIITDKEYPVRPAYTLLNKVLEEFLVAVPDWQTINDNTNDKAINFNNTTIQMYLSKYQDPSQADSIMKVQHELDETKIVLHKTIESVLQRGEKLDNLVDKSHDLTASSKMFYKQAKKTNSCCVIM
ncbi:palmitoyltransferase [Hanseniaspora osmophila]|uniref:Synaptobrevin homolog YKT6 n=1 Tax=Hanseniaspora osmophila TaxID=56408 RepID=A0A1E5RHL3_9ASCO|nr:Synaptobrevin YKT6 [Hanseniaspora osmophila]